MTSIKEMYDYGYKWIGAIPLKDYHEALFQFTTNHNTILILWCDGSESCVEFEEDILELKDNVMYAIERDIRESKLIKKAIQELKKPLEGTRRGKLSDICQLERNKVWQKVLNILDFSDEEILLMVNHADLMLEGVD